MECKASPDWQSALLTGLLQRQWTGQHGSRDQPAGPSVAQASQKGSSSAASRPLLVAGSPFTVRQGFPFRPLLGGRIVGYRTWAIVLLAAVLAACGGSGDTKSNAARPTNVPVIVIRNTATAGPTLEWTRLERYLPSDNELPDRVAYQARFDLSNEKAASTPQQLKDFQDAGRITGIQYAFSVEAGARTISIGISYYAGADEPKKLLRNSGDPTDHTAPGRFEVPGLGDEYIARRLRLGAGEAVANVINLAWVRGNFFVSLADLGGTADTPIDIAVQMARLIDAKLKADPNP